jgi:competence protein ComEC
MHAKTLIAVLGLSLGIAAGYLSSYASDIAVASFVIVIVLSAVLYLERKSDARGIAFSLLGVIFFFACTLGIVRVQFESEPSPFACEAVCGFDGTIDESPSVSDEYQTLVIHVDDDHENVQAKVPLYPRYAAGELINVYGKVTIPETTYPHAGAPSFDYSSYLRNKHVGSEMLYPKLEVVDSEAHTMKYMLMRLKENLVSIIDMYVKSPESSLASGMLFGNASTGKELKDTFRVAGLSHIVVLSGYNIALVVSFTLLLLMFVPLIVRVVASGIFVFLFVLMVGGEASVIRAMLMAFVSLLATLTGREYVARQALLLSFLCIIAYEPYGLLHDVSLHLSFLATAGIVYWNESILAHLKKWLPSFIADVGSTTLAAYAATIPYLMYTFGTVSVYALLANIIVLPFIPLMMCAAFATVFASFVAPIAGTVFGLVTSLIGSVILFVATSIAHLPFANVSVSLSLPIMGTLYAFILCGAYYLASRKSETLETTKEGYLTDVISF